MRILIDIFLGLLAILFVTMLYVIGRKFRTGLEESEYYDERSHWNE